MFITFILYFVLFFYNIDNITKILQSNGIIIKGFLRKESFPKKMNQEEHSNSIDSSENNDSIKLKKYHYIFYPKKIIRLMPYKQDRIIYLHSFVFSYILILLSLFTILIMIFNPFTNSDYQVLFSIKVPIIVLLSHLCLPNSSFIKTPFLERNQKKNKIEIILGIIVLFVVLLIIVLTSILSIDFIGWYNSREDFIKEYLLKK